MRMVTKFQRLVGGSPALGSDGAPGVPPTGAPGAQDNLLAQQCYSDQGWPAHRVAVAYNGPVGALALVAQLWVFDHLTEAWYEVGAPGSLTPNRITYFDVTAIVSRRAGGASGLGAPPSQGHIEALLVVQAAGGDPAGTYTFAMGADLTTLPI
jgi:hypothetical protein